ncbi:MAG: leucyl aminopeptidase [Deltaproteobacteria bacterium]|nr:leucyl aminopeptidase [Deltaproteobacteria bacterium]
MEAKFQIGRESWRGDCVLLPVFAEEDPLALFPGLGKFSSWLGSHPGLGDFKGKKGDTLLLYGNTGQPPLRVLLAGLGPRKEFAPADFGRAVAGAVRYSSGRGFSGLALPEETLHLAAGEAFSPSLLLEEAVLGAQAGSYAYTVFKSKSVSGEEEPPAPFSLALLCAGDIPEEERLAARRASALALGMTCARDVVNGPANVVTPEYMQEKAAQLAGAHGFRFSAHGPDFLRERGLNAFLAVSLGSAREPRLLVLEYAPPGMENAAPVILVGKGITFDSGGISLKPAAGMEKMKRDMAGAGTVLGLFAALGAVLDGDSAGEAGSPLCRRRVIGLMGCTENMPGGRASKPGDVVRTLSGKTVEITNTDAEGRLVLCDCLTLAQDMAEAEALIDIATLTGACVVALGPKTAGIFGNNDALIDKLLGLARKNGERMWPLPIWDEDLDVLKENVSADFNNTGPREGGASFAALFLKQFVRAGTPWAHLDIAGPASEDKVGPNVFGGATAFGMRTLWDFILATE